MGPTTLAEHSHRTGANAKALREHTQPTRKKGISNALNLSNIGVRHIRGKELGAT